MKTVAISGVIGWDVEPSDIRTALNEANGEDVRVEISSPGGFVMPGLEIFNLIRNYKGATETRLVGQAASMGSYIALAGDKMVAEDNAVFMIHNVRGLSMGDHNDLRKSADTFERLSNLLAKAYVAKTGKSIEDIRAMMDEETFLFGDEIVEEGFADEIISTKSDTDKETAVAIAQAVIADCIKTMKESDKVKDDTEQAAAMLGSMPAPVKKKQPLPMAEKKTEVTVMDLEKLKAEHPAVHAQAVAAGVAQGVTQERDRASAHLILGGSSGDMVTAIAAITDGSEMTAVITAKYQAAGMKKAELIARGEDNPDDLDTPASGPEAKTDEDRVADEVCAQLGYEEEGGKV